MLSYDILCANSCFTIENTIFSCILFIFFCYIFRGICIFNGMFSVIFGSSRLLIFFMLLVSTLFVCKTRQNKKCSQAEKCVYCAFQQPTLLLLPLSAVHIYLTLPFSTQRDKKNSNNQQQEDRKKTTEAGKRNKQCSAMLNAFTSPCVFGKMQCSKF